VAATIADVGPLRADKGEGGKYLLVPPGCNSPAQSGYIVRVHRRYHAFGLAKRRIQKPKRIAE
jgi:hypothetical protein